MPRAGFLNCHRRVASLLCLSSDIKSANLLIGDQYQLKVADFGLSRVLDSKQAHRTNKVRPPL